MTFDDNNTNKYYCYNKRKVVTIIIYYVLLLLNFIKYDNNMGKVYHIKKLFYYNKINKFIQIFNFTHYIFCCYIK